MMQRHRSNRRGSALGWACVLALTGGVIACEGRTLLEGEPLEVPPALSLDQTATPAQVHAGTALRVRAVVDGRTGGVARVRLDWTGAFNGTAVRVYEDTPESVVVDTTIAVPTNVEGPLTVAATATNTAGLQSESVQLTVMVLGADTDPPQVAVASAVPDRIEAGDSLSVSVQCRDLGETGQLAWCGYTVLFMPPDADTIAVTRRDTVPGRDTAAIHDVIPVEGYDPETLPTHLEIEVHGFAIDASGNCAAGVEEAWSSRICIGEPAVRADADPDPTDVTVVAATTIRRSWGGQLAELAVDVPRGLVYGSVIDRNRIEVLDFIAPRDDARRSDILVGSRPAGITVDVTGDTLIVANSGGTSLSFVDLETGVEHSRLETPNAVLYEVPPCLDDSVTAPITFWQDYGDRPLRVAQDEEGVIMYSTASGGPIRIVEHEPGWEVREANILLWSDVVDPNPTNPTWAVTYVDSIVIEPENVHACNAQTDEIVIYDHVPGFPDQRISARSTIENFTDAIEDIQAQGSDIVAYPNSGWATGYWDVGQDARFATSGDRSTIAIADGNRAWTWIATSPRPGFENRIVSWYVSIQDLTNNMGFGGITGVAADGAGSQFSLRGGSALVYFDDLLRMHGSHEAPTLGADAGLALHPTDRLAFAPTNDRSVVVLQTAGHYQEVGELPLVRNLVGAVHFSLPRSGDPSDLVGRLHALDADGNVVTLPVRQSDLQ